MSIYITFIREHVESTPELPALIKTSSVGGENMPCKNGSGKRGRFKKKKKKEETVAAYRDYYYQGFFKKTKGGYLRS